MSAGFHRLLAYQNPALVSARLRRPQLLVAWEPRRRNFVGSLRAVFAGPKAPKEFRGGPYFRDAWVHSRVPRRALLASVLWHVLLVIFPFPIWRESAQQTQLRLPQIEVTWYGPLADFPPLSPPGPPAKPSLPGEPSKPLPRRGADAFHPRQTIISAPSRPTHPRQTLIQPDAPPVPPKILPQLPNVVQWATAQPARPRLHISQEALARLRPKRVAMRPLSELPVPELPNLEKPAGELNIASSPLTVPKPRLPMVAASVPRAGPRRAGQDAAPVPDIAPSANGGVGGVQSLIALSAAPAAPAPQELENLPIPTGNLAARFSISPEGTQPGVPRGSPDGVLGAGSGPSSTGGTGGSDNGSGPPGVSISGGNPNEVSSVSGVGVPGPTGLAPARPTISLPLHPVARLTPADPSRTPPSPGFEHIKPSAAPEALFGPKRVYTLYVNMPNLASATGSWILSFVEMQRDDDPGQSPSNTGELNGPVPLRKVDPKYPPALIQARVQGEVVLYAIIRQDGTVDSIQVIKGLEPELDNNAMEALARWKFRPAYRKGTPVELEAVVRIPFRAVAPLY